MKQSGCALLKIGEVAKEAGVNIQTVRYYERRGILSPAGRLDSGYRLYCPILDSLEIHKEPRGKQSKGGKSE